MTRSTRVPRPTIARKAAIARIKALRDALWERAKLPRTISRDGQGAALSNCPRSPALSLDDGALIMNPVEVNYEDALRVLEGAY